MTKRSLYIVALAVIATLLSSYVPREVNATFPDIMGCNAGCRVVAGGWPFAYLIDYPGISPVGSVELTSGLLGVDQIWPLALAGTFASWAAALGGCCWLLSVREKK